MPDDANFGDLGGTEIDAPESSAPPAVKGEDQEVQAEPDNNIPFHEHPRWKEVYGQAQLVPQLKKELEELRSQFKQGPPPQTDGQPTQWTPKTWDEVLQRAVMAMESRIAQAQEQQSVQVQEEDRQLESALTSLRTEKGEFDERKLLETAYKYGISDLGKAYEIMQMSGEAEKRGEKMALKKTKASTIGSSKKTEGGAKQQTPYKALQSTSLDEIVADAAEAIRG